MGFALLLGQDQPARVRMQGYCLAGVDIRSIKRSLMKTVVLLFLLIGVSGLANGQANTAKPWTFWWWMGSAVNEKDITYQLEAYAKSGLGGVHIIPIYGVKGFENQHISYLSKRWMEVFLHTLKEANRLGMGVDLTMGTGWPFGGPRVAEADVAKQLKIDDGKIVVAPTKQYVKRAAPGGEGFAIDPFSKEAIQHYMVRFDTTLARLPLRPRAFYNDSYETYGANWTNDFLEKFKSLRGYDFDPHVQTSQQTHDYHETLADLLRGQFTQTWTDWCRQRGIQTRHQAHGSPGNILDLYALADIPETEAFGSKAFNIPFYRTDPDYEESRFGRPHVLTMKMASSAAHLMGKKWVSSETATWLGNHFKVSLAQVKPEIDELFTAGINHVFYHGTTYSPPSEGFPGWLFYASTNFGMQSHVWEDMPALNGYIKNVQTELQSTQPDNEILLYFPIHDIWQRKNPRNNGVHLMDVHFSGVWLNDTPFGKIAQKLWDKGFGFDYVSDLQLENLSQGQIPSKTYKTILVPPSRHVPEKTQQALEILKNKGFVVEYVQNDAAFEQPQALVLQEKMAAKGLRFIRKRGPNYTLYFITNPDTLFKEGYVSLAKATENVVLYDPMTEQKGQVPSNKAGVWLQLKAGQSVVVFVYDSAPSTNAWQYAPRATNALKFLQKWTLTLPDQKPLPLAQMQSWTSLGDTAFTAYFSGKGIYENSFFLRKSPQKNLLLTLGDVRETAEIWVNGNNTGKIWALPFEHVIDKKYLKKGKNNLKIVVRNLSANAVRRIDKEGKPWKKFYDINIVDIQYKPLDVSKWQAVPSGLLSQPMLWQE